MGESNDLVGQILNHGPSQGTLFLVLTKMKEEGRPLEVIQGCLKALNIYPDDIRLRSLLAESYLEGGFIGQAEAELDRITSDIGNLVSAYKVQAQLYLRQQRTEEALEAVERFLALRPTDQEALDLLNRIKPPEEEVIAELTEEEQPPETQRISDTPAPAIVEEEDEKPELATPTLAEMYYYQGQIEEAISTYEKVVLNNPDDKASTVRLSEIRVLTTDETGAKDIGGKNVKAKSQRMMSVLEGWLDKIQELKDAR